MQGTFQVGLGGNFVLFFMPIWSLHTASYTVALKKALWVTSCIFQNLTLTTFWKCKLNFQASKAFWRFYLRCLLYNSRTPLKTYGYLWNCGIASTESLLNQSKSVICHLLSQSWLIKHHAQCNLLAATSSAAKKVSYELLPLIKQTNKKIKPTL